MPSHEVVPGNVILLQACEKLAADMRLFGVNGLHIDEAPINGELLRVDKQETPGECDAVLGDRRAMASTEPWLLRVWRMA